MSIGRQFFAHDTLRRVLVAFEYLWTDFPIARFNEVGEVIEVIIPPVDLATRDRALGMNQEMLDRRTATDEFGPNRGFIDQYPRFAYSIGDISFAPGRRKPGQGYKLVPAAEAGMAHQVHNAAPYDITLNMTFASKSLNDAMQVFERVAFFFSPTYNLRGKDAVMNEVVDMPFTLTNISFDDNADAGFDDFRLITLDMTFTTKVDIYGPTGGRNESRVHEAMRRGLGMRDPNYVEKTLNWSETIPVIQELILELAPDDGGEFDMAKSFKVEPETATSADEFEVTETELYPDE